MNNNRFRVALLLLLLAILNLSCQLTRTGNTTSAPSPTAEASSPSPETTLVVGTEQPVSIAAREPEDVEAAYLEALKQKDFDRVAALISDYSLSLSGNSREDIISYFEQKDFEGWRLIDYRVLESKVINDQTVLIHVMTKETYNNNDPQIYDYWFAMRNENGEWRINDALLVDDLTLTVEPQTINNLTIQPLRIVRYTDGLRLIIRIENMNDKGCFWGWVNDRVATLYFSDGQVVDAYGSLKIEPKRTYPDAYVDIDGFFDTYPVAVDLSSWLWASDTSPDLPAPGSETWTYHFDWQEEAP